MRSKMDSIQEVVPSIVAFLVQRHFQLEFRVSHVLFRQSTTEDGEDAEDHDNSKSGSIDSENQQILIAEDAVMASLPGYQWKNRKVVPEL